MLTIALVQAAVAAAAIGEIPADVLARVKGATVLVNASGRYAESSGSGFVLAVKGRSAYVVTNAHTTVLEGKPAGAVSVVFNSGQSNERTMDCEVIARDDDLDLAVLKVSADAPPLPLAVPPKVDVRETMEIHVVGFPFGRMLALGGGNPAVTIGKGTVSSLRNDTHGYLQAIQIDGDINPGNSGGPILTREGVLIGICVAKIRNTGIGLAIPVSHLQSMMRGRVKSVDFKEGEPVGGSTPFEVTATLIDPMRNVKQVTLLTLAREKAPSPAELKPRPDGSWTQLLQATSHDLKLTEDAAAVTVRLAALRDRRAGYWYQIKTVDADGRTVCTEPCKVYVSPDRPVGAVTSGQASAKKVDPGDDWLGQPASSAGGSTTGPAPTPKAITRTLAGKKVTLDGAVAVRIELPGRDLIEDMVWSADGKAFVAVEKSGILRKIAAPGLTQMRELDLRSACGAMSPSSEGFVLLMPAREEIWLIEPERLDVVRRIPVRGITAVGTGSGSSRAVAAFAPAREADSLAVIDLKTGKTMRQYRYFDLSQQAGKTLRRHETSATLREIDLLSMTGDGKFLLVLSQGCLHRLAVKDASLEYEEIGPRIAPAQRGRIEISNDSRYVAVLSGAGNAKVDDHPDLGGYGTYVYSIADLQQPVISLQQGAYPRTLAFDKKRRVLYSQNVLTQCLVFETNGRLDKKWLLPDAGTCRRHVLLADCSQMLTLTDSSLFWVGLRDKPPP